MNNARCVADAETVSQATALTTRIAIHTYMYTLRRSFHVLALYIHLYSPLKEYSINKSHHVDMT